MVEINNNKGQKMKTYDCKISFKSICNESDLKNKENEMYRFFYNKIWNLGNFKFEFKENKKLTKKKINNE